MNENQLIAEPQYDLLTLPSEGLFYPSKKKAVKVTYLTTEDENILTSPNLVQSGTVLDVLLDKKVMDKDLRPKDMLSCDRNAILFWLRATAYGESYTVTIKDPKNGKPFETDIDITQFTAKPINVLPDENGYVSFTLPKSKKVIKYKYLTISEDDAIVKMDESRMSKMGGGISQLLTKRLEAQIVEVDGITDKSQIQLFVKSMLPYDSSALRSYMNENEPLFDTTINVQAPSGEFFFGDMPITAKFLWPYIKL